MRSVGTCTAFVFLCLCIEYTHAFSLTQVTNKQHCLVRLKSATSHTVELKAKVSRVSVCTGELCQCQGEEYEFTGGAADAALQKLQSLDLSFPIDDVGCMGVCGMGTMIAIDYEGGGSIMTDGLEGALRELGVQTESLDVKSEHEPVIVGEVIVDESEVNNEATAPALEVIASSESQEVAVRNPTNKPKELVDVRDRMREEAAREEEQGNPWLNMASYLAKKAIDKVAGNE